MLIYLEPPHIKSDRMILNRRKESKPKQDLEGMQSITEPEKSAQEVGRTGKVSDFFVNSYKIYFACMKFQGYYLTLGRFPKLKYDSVNDVRYSYNERGTVMGFFGFEVGALASIGTDVLIVEGVKHLLRLL
jgi:hypothetical protein